MTTQLLNHTLSNHEMHPSVYVACLSSYNNGILYGTWIDAAQPLEDILKQIQQLLAKSPMPGSEEFAIHSYESFGTLCIEEYESLQQVHEKALFIVGHRELGAELMAYYGGKLEDAKRALEDNYMGEYESELDYAIHLFDECYLSDIPENLQYYIDYDKFQKDIFVNDYFSIQVGGSSHIFAYH